MQRDYDKEPVVIKDINTFFDFLPAFVCMIISYIAYFLTDNPSSSLHRNVFIIMPFLALPYIRPFIKCKREIIITKNTINYLNNGEVLESIDLNKPFKIYKSFSVAHHKSQKPHEVIQILWIFLLPATILQYFINFILKLFYYIFTLKLKYYKVMDSVILLQDEKIINILSIEKYHELEKYFKDNHNINIKELKIYFHKYGYIYEKINSKNNDEI